MKNYFSFHELVHTNSGIKNEPYLPDYKKNLSQLRDVLSVLRHFVGKPIRVNSGFRSEALNIHVKGAPNSYHLVGRAADISCSDSTMEVLDYWCKTFYDRGIFIEYINHVTYIHVAI